MRGEEVREESRKRIVAGDVTAMLFTLRQPPWRESRHPGRVILREYPQSSQGAAATTDCAHTQLWR